MIVKYIDEHRDIFGDEPICGVLSAAGCKVAPSTYFAAKTRPVSARRRRDQAMLPILMALWVANYRVYELSSCGRPLAVPAMTSAGTRSLG